MSYAVKEIFLTLQGEGRHSGRRAVFVRLAGCNGWSGREEDRGKGPLACSSWCDTDFVGTNGANGGRYEAAQLAAKCSEVWGPGRESRFVVLTGGEPLLQVDSILCDALHRFEFEIAVETNGTKRCPREIDWITVSPKPGLPLAQKGGNELKLVYPQEGVHPEQFSGLEFTHRYLQPKWTSDEAARSANVQAAVQYCLGNPWWKLGLQVHKSIGLP